MNFSNKIVLVTGAGKGIGRCIAMTYAEQGAHVVIADKNEQDLKQTGEQIRKIGPAPVIHVTDVGRPDDIVLLMEKTEQQFGHLDILINNAGMMIRKSPYELTIEDWDQVLNVNLRGVFLCTREAAKMMRKAGRGAVVNIASTRALMSEADTEAYSASKGGIVALTHALAVSLGTDGIRVNSISPGWIETGDYSGLREVDHMQHPAGRVGVPADIARACLFLTEDKNDFITGTNMVIDGGMTRKMIYEED